MQSEPKPWTLIRPEYWKTFAQEVAADAVQLELNIKWLVDREAKR